MTLIWGLLTNRIVRSFLLVVAVALGVYFYGLYKLQQGLREGRLDAATQAAEETIQRVEQGNSAVVRNRGGDPTERLRNNDQFWQ